MALEYSINDYISNSTNSELNMTETHFLEVMETSDTDVILLSSSLYEKYYDEIMSHSRTYQLTSEEERKYFYNPQRLSYDLFGTINFWNMILEMNQLYSATQFSINPIKVPTMDVVELLQHIVNLNQEEKDRNESEIKQKTL